MGRFRTARIVLALLLFLFPLRSFAGTIVSVSMMPPPLPAYDQPPCPDQNLVWVPGYWAWSQRYYWIPGAWVEPPFAGAMWTPGHWNWSHHPFTLYTWHSGYWSYHVGYYGGVNYGYGYGGLGYSGGVWHGSLFAYNLEIVRVDNRWVRETFRDPGLVERGYIDRNNHSSFNGGPGGVAYQISPEEQAVEHEHHWEPTAFQLQYEAGFRDDQTYWYETNHGQPAQVTYATPLFADPSHEHRDWNEHRDLYVQREQPEHPDADARYRPGNNKVEQTPSGSQEFHPESGQHPPAGSEFNRNAGMPQEQNPANKTSSNPPGTEAPANAQTPPPNSNPHPESKDKKPAPKPKSDKDKKTN
jgi:hypothetical protein